MTALILARAGGGQNFGGGFGRGGGGGGFGGGGGVGGSGFHFGFFPVFVGGGGVVLFILVGLVLFAALNAARRREPPVEPPLDLGDTGGGPAWSPPEAERPAPVGPGLDAIRAHDPAFDRDGFLAGVERAFFLVQEAWTERKPDLSRQVMADGIWTQHKSQIEGYAAGHKRNLLDDLSVGSATITAAASDQTYDTITVRLLAACADYDVDDESGKVVRGDRQVRQWMEDWTFQRSSDATTRADGGTLQRRCPNCGAPLEADLSGTCPYCRAPVMSGKYDWVLTRIDQVNAGAGVGW